MRSWPSSWEGARRARSRSSCRRLRGLRWRCQRAWRRLRRRAAEVPSKLPPPPPKPRERTLDQVILEYLTNEADQEQLVLMIEDERDLAFGRQATMVLRASSSKSGAPMVGTQVSVRMISTVTEPRVLASGRADDQGLAMLVFEIPQIGRGTAALIITAVSSIGRAELKHLL